MVVFIVVVVVVVIIIIIILFFFCLPLVTGLRSRFLGGKDSFLKCFKQPFFFGIVYCQKFPIIARIIIIIIIVIKND